MFAVRERNDLRIGQAAPRHRANGPRLPVHRVEYPTLRGSCDSGAKYGKLSGPEAWRRVRPGDQKPTAVYCPAAERMELVGSRPHRNILLNTYLKDEWSIELEGET